MVSGEDFREKLRKLEGWVEREERRELHMIAMAKTRLDSVLEILEEIDAVTAAAVDLGTTRKQMRTIMALCDRIKSLIKDEEGVIEHLWREEKRELGVEQKLR